MTFDIDDGGSRGQDLGGPVALCAARQHRDSWQPAQPGRGTGVPNRPKRGCNKRGCPATHRNRNGYCDAHAALAPKPFAAARRSTRAYGDSAYKRAAQAFLAKHRTCLECGAPSRCLHHDPPHRGDRAQLWDRSTWRALCKQCHDVATAREVNGRRNGPPPLVFQPGERRPHTQSRANNVSRRVFAPKG